MSNNAAPAEADAAMIKPPAELSEKTSDTIWAPPHIWLPVCAGLSSLLRVDPVPSELVVFRRWA